MNFLANKASPKDDDLIMLLNNDVLFNDTASIKKMIDIIETDPNVGIVGAKLLYTGSNKIQHCGVVFTEDRTKPGARTMPIHLKRGHEADEHTSKNRVFQACTAAVLLTRASLFREVGGLDEGFRWAFEDISFCLNISKVLKKKVVMCGETSIYHDESATLKINPVNKLYLSQNINHFISRWYGKVEADVRRYLHDTNYNLYVKP
jgi:GT2 family glycosyltransferase